MSEKIAMRAKMKLMHVERSEHADILTFKCVPAKSYEGAPGGVHEDNVFSKFSPTGEFKIHCTNPALLGKFQPGDTYYFDATPVPAEKL